MPRVDPDELDAEELARIFVAATMAEARIVEALLSSRGVRYAVVAEPIGRTLFGSPRNAAVFYVVAEDADGCAALLVAGGLEAGVVRADAD